MSGKGKLPPCGPFYFPCWLRGSLPLCFEFMIESPVFRFPTWATKSPVSHGSIEAWEGSPVQVPQSGGGA